MTVKICLIILATFALAFLTSWLLSWEWIQETWPRMALVILLMAVELILGLAILKNLVAPPPPKN